MFRDQQNLYEESIENMASDTDRVVASRNLEEIIDNYITWNNLTVG